MVLIDAPRFALRTQEVGPCHELIYGGINIDSQRMIISITEARKQALVQLLQEVSDKESISLKDAQRVAGKLNHCCHVLRQGKPFLNRLLDEMRSANAKGARVLIGTGLRDDLLWWLRVL